MGSISSLSNNNNSHNNNLKKVVAIVGMIFILFVISEVSNAIHRRKKVTSLSLRTHQESNAPTATADSLYDVSNASLFSSLDAEFEWDRFMIPGYDYHQNRGNSNNDEEEGSNPSPSASKRDTERTLFDFNRITSHHLRRRQK